MWPELYAVTVKWTRPNFFCYSDRYEKSERAPELTVFGTTQFVVEQDFDATESGEAEVRESPQLMKLEMRRWRDE